MLLILQNAPSSRNQTLCLCLLGASNLVNHDYQLQERTSLRPGDSRNAPLITPASSTKHKIGSSLAIPVAVCRFSQLALTVNWVSSTCEQSAYGNRRLLLPVTVFTRCVMRPTCGLACNERMMKSPLCSSEQAIWHGQTKAYARKRFVTFRATCGSTCVCLIGPFVRVSRASSC